MADRRTQMSVTTEKMFMFSCVFYLSWTSVRAEIHSAVLDKQTGQLSLEEGFRDDYVAWANFTDDIKNSG